MITSSALKRGADSLVLIIYLICLESLIYIINLNQPVIFIQLAFILFFYILLHITLLYDLHFRNPKPYTEARQKYSGGNNKLFFETKIFVAALWNRIEHLRRWKYLRHWQNYLILPGIIFWTTVCLMYLNMGHAQIQQLWVLLSFLALGFVHLHLTKIFLQKDERINDNSFAVFSAIKLYAAFLTFSSVIGLARYFCLESSMVCLGIFALAFLLIYQALFQHNLINLKSLFLTTIASMIISVVGVWVYHGWGLNYFTAGVFLMAIYNFIWGILHYYLEKTLTLSKFVELIAINLVVVAVAIGVTNFHAKILDACY